MQNLAAFKKDLHSDVEPIRQSAINALELANKLADGERLCWYQRGQVKKELLGGDNARSIKPKEEGLVLPYSLTVERYWKPIAVPQVCSYVGEFLNTEQLVYSITEKTGYKRVENGTWKTICVDTDVVKPGPSGHVIMAMWSHLETLIEGKLIPSDSTDKEHFFVASNPLAIKETIKSIIG